MNAIIAGVVEALTPWKEVIGSAFAALAAVGALVSGVLKQRGRTDTTFAPPVPAPAGTVRLHADDRESLTDFRSTLGDLREAVEDLTRVTRQNTKATEDHQEAIERMPRGGGGRR
ncbi:hypothetical protein [Methylobacterium indicum]|uniref:Uncharacterized protein n=1 Tax=Methylobacterium indicum TaxID=1775910 RepID=A0A8H8WSJ4_9HYPH|nr:hypothetical protein [Methylobacterium indicum]BCM83569.1 hypothetical protein mvi_20300 [Methylobacterium indicum]